MLEIALSYSERGWNPIPYRAKGPLDNEWQKRTITKDNAADYFNSQPGNIGVLLGPKSRGLADIDCDCQDARCIAPYVLPKTSSIFGRASSRAAHRLYYSDVFETAERAVYKYADDSKTMLELRCGTKDHRGAQTSFPVRRIRTLGS
jgi:putative DNA primase/helicase